MMGGWGGWVLVWWFFVWHLGVIATTKLILEEGCCAYFAHGQMETATNTRLQPNATMVGGRAPVDFPVALGGSCGGVGFALALVTSLCDKGMK